MDNHIILSPFGIQAHATPSCTQVTALPADSIVSLLEQHKLLVLRGFQPLADAEFIAFANRFGPLLCWEFGEICNLRVEPKPANHLFRTGRVEMHWDGAYLRDEPRYSLFQCIESSAPGGGETIFTDTTRLLDRTHQSELERWRHLKITYRTDKAAHYGGEITVPLVSRNRHSGHEVIRFIEPFNEDNMDINPVDVFVNDLPAVEQREFLTALTQRLYGADVMYRHAWETGDFLMYDNNVLLHGRARLEDNATRKLKRIHVMEPNGSMNRLTPVFIGVRKQDVHV